MTLAEKMAGIITENIVSLKTFLELQEAKGLPEPEFEITVALLKEKITNLINDHTEKDKFLGFLEYIYRPGESKDTDRINNDLHYAAFKGWEIGYIRGFADRENLLLGETDDNPDENDIRKRYKLKKEESPASAPTLTRESL